MIRRDASSRFAFRRGFTLVELLITVSIIAIMASMVLFAMFQAQDAARAQKTRTLIAKLNNIVMTRYDEYRTRRVPYQFPSTFPNAPPGDRLLGQKELAHARLDCLRDLMRMEMPDRWSDVTDNPVAPYAHTLNTTTQLPAYVGQLYTPVVREVYLAKYNAAYAANPLWPTLENQGAECLYMIVMAATAQQGDSRDVFKATDIGDTDGDSCLEFLDGWGNPIQFIRWAPGYLSDLQAPIRIKGNVGGAGLSRTLTVTANDGPRLSQTPGSYVGGALALIDKDTQLIDTQSMARITGYRYVTGATPSVTFTCAYPGYATEEPFDGNNPPSDSTFVVMQPDPFDSRGVYPDFVNIVKPTYALYPLIFSKGSDRAAGVKDDRSVTVQLHYANERLNPFYIAPPISEPFGLMLGGIPQEDTGETNWKLGCHLDNITNHQPNTR